MTLEKIDLMLNIILAVLLMTISLHIALQMRDDYKKNRDKEDSRWKPIMDQLYFYVDPEGAIFRSLWKFTIFDADRLEIGNCFATEELAELHALRLEAMANRWKPEYGEFYYYWSFNSKQAVYHIWRENHNDFIIGNVHRTEKEAKEYGAKYDKAFRVLWEGDK